MMVSYCDLCGCVIKRGWFVTYDTLLDRDAIVEAMARKDYENAKGNVVTKEVCNSCQLLMIAIFAHKKDYLNNLKTEIENSYYLPSPKHLEVKKAKKRKNE